MRRRRSLRHGWPGQQASDRPGGQTISQSEGIHYMKDKLALLTAAGFVIAAAGALGPATWAAVSRATTALHAE
jgi:hypothetical protein